MGWTQKGKLVVPDGSNIVSTANIDGEEVTPLGLTVKKFSEPTAQPKPREIKRFMKKMQKKQAKEANKKLLQERFGYLRKDRKIIPEIGPAPLVIKGDN